MKLLVVLSLAAACSSTYIPIHLSKEPDATVDFVAAADNISGQLKLYSTFFGGVLITGQIRGLSRNGRHGFHVHQNGDLSDGCVGAGGHFNPFQTTHGAPWDLIRHVGDLGNIQSDKDGIAHVHIYDPVISLKPGTATYIGNRAIVVHQGVDDLGRGGNEGSLSTGNAGSRSGCGIIEH